MLSNLCCCVCSRLIIVCVPARTVGAVFSPEIISGMLNIMYVHTYVLYMHTYLHHRNTHTYNAYVAISITCTEHRFQ